MKVALSLQASQKLMRTDNYVKDGLHYCEPSKDTNSLSNAVQRLIVVLQEADPDSIGWTVTAVSGGAEVDGMPHYQVQITPIDELMLQGS
jgi:hypothetical protein